MRRYLPAAVILVVCVTLLVAGQIGGGGKPDRSFAERDFHLDLKLVESDCEPSGVCLIRYKLVPGYVGDASDLQGSVVTVRYRIIGGTSPESGTLVITDGAFDDVVEEVRTDGEARVQAVVTAVDA